MKYYLYIIFSFIIWSTYGVIIKIYKLNPFALILYVSLSGIFFIYYYIKKKGIKLNLTFKNLLYIMLASILLFGNTITYFYALKFTSITNTILSHYAAPIIAAFFIPVFLDERIEKRTIIALLLSFIGILLIFFPEGKLYISRNDLIGIILGLSSAVCYAFLIIIGKFLIKTVHSLYLMFYENIFSMIIVLTLFPIIKSNLKVAFTILGLYFILGITHNFIAPLLYLEGLKRVKAQSVAILGYIEPVSAILFEIILLKYIPHIGTIIGGILIITGGLIVVYNDNRKCEIS